MTTPAARTSAFFWRENREAFAMPQPPVVTRAGVKVKPVVQQRDAVAIKRVAK